MHRGHQKCTLKTESTPIFGMGGKQCSDYQVFGMVQPGRSSGLGEQRHLFNGMESDNEVSGDGNSYTTQFRQYDPRLGRWKSIDPLAGKYPGQSPYAAFNNNPVFYTDPLGLEGEPPEGLPENPDNEEVATAENGNKYVFEEQSGKWIHTKDDVDIAGKDRTKKAPSTPSKTAIYAEVYLRRTGVRAIQRAFTSLDKSLYKKGSEGSGGSVPGGTNYRNSEGNNQQAIKGGTYTDVQKMEAFPGATAGGSRQMKYRKFRMKKGGSLKDFNNTVKNAKSGVDVGEVVRQQTTSFKKPSSKTVEGELQEKHKIVMVDKGQKFSKKGIRYFYQTFSNGVTKYYKDGERVLNFIPAIKISKEEYKKVK